MSDLYKSDGCWRVYGKPDFSWMPPAQPTHTAYCDKCGYAARKQPLINQYKHKQGEAYARGKCHKTYGFTPSMVSVDCYRF